MYCCYRQVAPNGAAFASGTVNESESGSMDSTAFISILAAEEMHDLPGDTMHFKW
jgi:hypothetical protein